MKIAIVTPHPIPFALGGAENLWWGLQDHIERNTAHSCDIVSVSSPETALRELVSSYETFSRLDLSAYDMVISGKYPAWMVNHPNHVCYMLHRLRGLYDTYGGRIGVDEAALPAPLGALVRWMQATTGSHRHLDDGVLPEFFERFRDATFAIGNSDALAFPGPLAREIVHFLDGIGLAPERIGSYAAISRTVCRRHAYFPADVHVSVLHPPPHRDDYRCGRDDYFFTSSRLDGPKRVGLLIEAMIRTKLDIQLLIAGTGPEEDRLKALAAGDDRIGFLGFVPDDAMPALYADALAVPFIPADEDYGLVTVEAMRSGKPVLTVSDAGGPCEFVRDGETGLIVSPDARALGKGLERLAGDRTAARRMGDAARAAVAPISWSTVFDGLMRPAMRRVRLPVARRPKLTVATTFPVWPPMGGGQARVFHLYRYLAERYDIDIVSLSDGGTQSETEIAPNVVEIRVPKSERHLVHQQALYEALDDTPIGDIAAHFLSRLTPEFGEALSASAAGCTALVACHPYLIEEIKLAAGKKPVWYEAQDVEHDLKNALLSPFPGSRQLVDAVRHVEARCWRESRHVFACANRDLVALNHRYGMTHADLHEVPNGVALDEIDFVGPQRRRALQEAAGLGRRPTALFMGSWHGPNLEAIEQVLFAAQQLPGMRFFVVGSACMPFRGRAIPGNVEMLGQVNAEMRNDLLSVAGIALNPMLSGSGTNLKMLDYFAAGMPVVSTRFGARGLEVQEDRHYIVAEDGLLAQALGDCMARGPGHSDGMVAEARALVEQRYSWQIIAQNFLAELEKSGAAKTAADP